jgi:ethanolamine utilization protein EutM
VTDALGMVELRGLTSALVAANIAVNSARVSIAGFGYLHDGQVTVSLRGSVDSVRAAVDAIGAGLAAGVVGATSVIGRVSPALEPVLRERAVPIGGRVGAPKVRGRGRGYPGPGSAATGTAAGSGGRRAAARDRPAKGHSGRDTGA